MKGWHSPRFGWKLDDTMWLSGLESYEDDPICLCHCLEQEWNQQASIEPDFPRA